MYSVIGKKNLNYLLADPNGADTFAIPCEPGNGVISAGTVMYRKETGLWAPADTANVAETSQLAVVGEDVDTTVNETVAEDAVAFRGGRFVYGKVTLADGGALTAAHMVILRKQGIVFDRMQESGTFDNKKS